MKPFKRKKQAPVRRYRLTELHCSECGFRPALSSLNPDHVWVMMRPHFAESGHQQLGYKAVVIPRTYPTLPASPGAHRRARRILARRYGKDWEGAFHSYKLERRIACRIFARTEPFITLGGPAIVGIITGMVVDVICR